MSARCQIKCQHVFFSLRLSLYLLTDTLVFCTFFAKTFFSLKWRKESQQYLSVSWLCDVICLWEKCSKRWSALRGGKQSRDSFSCWERLSGVIGYRYVTLVVVKKHSPETAFLTSESAPAPTVNVARPSQEHLLGLLLQARYNALTFVRSVSCCFELSSYDQECVTPLNYSLRRRLLAPVSQTIKKQIKAKRSFRQAPVLNGLMVTEIWRL